MNSKERFLAACRNQSLDRPPVWMMRQAGRYLPEYREVRARHSFLEMCKTPELAAEITLQPIRRFGMDAAILFSDILVVPEAMGISVAYNTGGPKMTPKVATLEDVEQLWTPDAARNLAFTVGAITEIRKSLGNETALIGFAGAPYTLATYMVEGGSSRELAAIAAMRKQDPAVLEALLPRLAEAVTDFLILQVKAGVDAVQIFDTWAGSLTLAEYERFAAPYTRAIVDALKPLGVPVILYINGIADLLESAASSGATVLGVDWRLDLASARSRTGGRLALQGNLDPLVLFTPPENIRQEVVRIHRSLESGTGHIFNLGHGILPNTPLEGAGAFIEAVRNLN